MERPYPGPLGTFASPAWQLVGRIPKVDARKATGRIRFQFRDARFCRSFRGLRFGSSVSQTLLTIMWTLPCFAYIGGQDPLQTATEKMFRHLARRFASFERLRVPVGGHGLEGQTAPSNRSKATSHTPGSRPTVAAPGCVRNRSGTEKPPQMNSRVDSDPNPDADSPTKAVRLWSTKLGHLIQDVTSDHGLGHPPGWITRHAPWKR